MFVLVSVDTTLSQAQIDRKINTVPCVEEEFGPRGG